MKHFFWIVAVIMIISACSSAKKTTAQALAQEKLNDVKYGPYDRNIMDVYLPANRTANTPFALLIHGGGWTGYGKEYIREYQDTMLAHGIAVASINHRYANDSTIHYKEMLADADAALTYCINHAAEWHTRSNNFVITGVSSGAHLALMYGFTSTKKINAIVEFSAPTNVSDTALLSYTMKVNLLDLIQKMVGKKFQPGQPLDAAFADASPVNHVRKDIPVLIIHGNADPVVPYVQALQLNEKLQQAGAVHKLVTLPNVGHSLEPKDSALKTMMYDEAVKWINTYGTKN